MKFKLSNFFSAMLGVIIGAGITLSVVLPQATKVNLTNASNNQINQTQAEQLAVISDANYENLYKNVVKSSMPSVVGITTMYLDDSASSYYEFFFGDNYSESRVRQGLGTGVIVDSNGFILTNSHVVEDGRAQKVNVIFNDGSSKEAEVKWTDTNLDLAIIKVDGTGYQAAKLGDSDKTEVGDIAIAIGNPLGLQFERTVTQGIISGLNRTVQLDTDNYMGNLLQTDASINNGNSGGPLLNSKGEVIGINTIKAAGGEGLGFSIPINTAKLFVQIMKENGEIKDKPILGIRGVSVDQIKDSDELKVSNKTGVYVYSVYKDSPAEKAGLKKDDIILKINDDNIKNMLDLQSALYKNGQDLSKPITVTIQRDSKEQNLTVQLLSKDEILKEKNSFSNVFNN